MKKKYKVIINDKKVEMTYEDICHDLGFAPECNFVRITTANTIGFWVATPDEARALVAACRRKGYKVKRTLQAVL